MKTSVVTIPVGAVLKNRCSSADRDMNNATWPAQERNGTWHETKRGKKRNVARNGTWHETERG